jgi:hypothetical protein
MTTRKTILWLAAVIWLGLTLFLWLSVLSPSNRPIVLAEPSRESNEPHQSEDYNPQSNRFTVHNATAQQLDSLSRAVRVFTEADLQLPGLDVWFHADLESCGDHHGRFRATSESWQIQICSVDIEFVYEHELAHAWIAANVDEGQRSAFMNLRDLDHWSGPDVAWNERGTEWAAVIIQQGLSGLPLPPALSHEARSRLESFESLTDMISPVLVDWITVRDVPCSDRPTKRSLSISDASGRTCGASNASLTVRRPQPFDPLRVELRGFEPLTP